MSLGCEDRAIPTNEERNVKDLEDEVRPFYLNVIVLAFLTLLMCIIVGF